ncbi:hypothetical protein EQ832_06780 [Pseudomonas sp. ALS1131]|nr:restriction endonuclease [Pseudomonas sp. ALS1131]TRO40496.1 hypothetical protein EQ832_06780 [Pseudomonas sp. ALS1131]
MSILDFKEIPEAHIASGAQDTFELFARDFLKFVGYKIITDPDRGADGSVDLVVEESRTGVGGETIVRWLVSCKHKASSGKSVNPVDDANIRDRVEANECQGFIGFYSTIASAGLAGNLKGLKGKIEYQIFDREKIEGQLLHSARGLEIAERFFPKFLSAWKTENPQPAKIFAEKPSLQCKVCHKELLEQEDHGIITIWQKMSRHRINDAKHFEHVFWVCRGRCDDVLTQYMRQKDETLIDGWEDISDVLMPTIFIKWIMTIMNGLRSGETYSYEAYESMKDFLLQIFPYTCRHLTEKEKERIKSLTEIPAYLGGLGYEG